MNHRKSKPIGYVQSIDLKEDGLYVAIKRDKKVNNNTWRRILYFLRAKRMLITDHK